LEKKIHQQLAAVKMIATTEQRNEHRAPAASGNADHVITPSIRAGARGMGQEGLPMGRIHPGDGGFP